MADETTNQHDFHNTESVFGDNAMSSAPFAPTVEEAVTLTEDGFVTDREYEVTFNQGYVFNTVADDFIKSDRIEDEAEAKIDNMGATFTLPKDFNLTEEPESGFYVKVTIDANNFLVTGAYFDLYDITGISGDFPEIIFAEDLTIEQRSGVGITGDASNSSGDAYSGNAGSGEKDHYVGYFPVCYMRGGSIEELTLRDNIHLSDRQFCQMGANSEPSTGELDETSGSATSGEQTGVSKGEALVLLKKNKELDEYPVRVRSVRGGSGIQVTQLENTIKIDADHSQAEISGWSGDCIGYLGKCVYVEGTAGTVADPAEFRRIAGNSVDGVSVTLEQPVGQEEYLKINAPWDAENCKKDGVLEAKYANAKNVYKPRDNDGTEAIPAIFRRISGSGIVNVTYGNEDPKVGAIDDNCLIVIGAEEQEAGTGSGVWSGKCCGTEYDDTVCVYQDDHSGPDGKKSLGTTANPAVFRRLSGAGTVSIPDIFHDTDAWDACVITISGECCSGVINTGDEGARVYIENTNDPAILRRLREASNSNNMMHIHESADGKYIDFDAGWTGENIGGEQQVFVAGGGPPSSNAQFRTLKGAGDVTVSTDGNTINIEGRSPWTGENVGTCSNSADIYDVESGPAEGQKAKFRKIYGAGTTSSTDDPKQINVIQDTSTDCILIRGNAINGQISIPSQIALTGAGSGEQIGLKTDVPMITIKWKDGLITEPVGSHTVSLTAVPQ